MIPKHLESEILRLYHAEKWRVNTIATQLHVHHGTVQRVLVQNGIRPENLATRPSIVDPYLPFMLETLKKYPSLTAASLYRMVKQRGFTGNPDHFRSIVARYRPRPIPEAYLRIRTLPGEQAQVDWAHFGKVQVGKAARRLLAFVMVLSYSRRIFLRFYLGDAMPNFLRGHAAAFDFFGGVPREILYDNLKSAVLERFGDAIHFNPTILDLAAHYRFAPKPVAVARGNEKGRVERAIRYIRQAFFEARKWKDLDDLNAQAIEWCLGMASERRCPEDPSLTVAQAFEQEQPRLLLLPDNPFPTEERQEVRVGKTPYVRFDLNDYSVPHTHTRKTLTVAATLEQVRILDGPSILATHTRSFDRGQQIEDPAHIQALVDFKREGRQYRGIDRLHHAVPATKSFLETAVDRGLNLGGMVSGLTSLLDLYGAKATQDAVQEAFEAGACHLPAVRQLLERNRRERGLPPPVNLELPNDPRVRDLVVVPHALDVYDTLTEEAK